ncbi:hypothetical protein HMPREF0043_01130 [Actinobaculum sp. oral taxon 183 str. F0552]|nr:hypothetical protein HMPREF0043_01130 [Actinobaculum sp. oral taxon 183 str. F0552]
MSPGTRFTLRHQSRFHRVRNLNTEIHYDNRVNYIHFNAYM